MPGDVIRVSPGVYREQIVLQPSPSKVTIMGEGVSPADVVVTWSAEDALALGSQVHVAGSRENFSVPPAVGQTTFLKHVELAHEACDALEAARPAGNSRTNEAAARLLVQAVYDMHHGQVSECFLFPVADSLEDPHRIYKYAAHLTARRASVSSSSLDDPLRADVCGVSLTVRRWWQGVAAWAKWQCFSAVARSHVSGERCVPVPPVRYSCKLHLQYEVLSCEADYMEPPVCM